MPTQLSLFCDRFDAAVRPLLAPLTDALQAAARALEATGVEVVSATLSELRNELDRLLAKVAAQNAYVLIFGPLKSGKSTLMNALAASYVSEVSSLPAYPCLVFVRHAPEREFVLTSYDGTVVRCRDVDDVHERISAAHGELANAIRTTEERGELFDPEQHHPAAIRRVEVCVPARSLADTAAVLVDTPGLYTRMRFGYDRMTRDFRDAAACAVFVVKSDTLFLEQVFAEFEQLLELFSRIFLVVNMDTTKRDVGPDGKLRPSLEQRDPESILGAFNALAMSAPLQTAVADGRVRIFAVDLMNAASQALQRGENAPELPAGFVEFRAALRAHLAGDDHLVAFVRDGLRRAAEVARGVRRVAGSPAVDALRGDREDAIATRDGVAADLALVDTLLASDWRDELAPWLRELTDEVERASRDTGARAARAMGAAIDTWFLSSHSLDWLIRSEWAPQVADYRAAVAAAAQRTFEQSRTLRNGGLALSTDTAALLERLDIGVPALRDAAFSAMPGPQPAAPIPLDTDSIPIRRGVLDVVTFRGADSVRRKVFGDGAHPDRKIPANVKAARLGDAGKHYLSQFLVHYRKQLATATVRDALRRFGDELTGHTVAALRDALRAKRPVLERRLAESGERIARADAVLDPLAAATDAASEAGARVAALASQHAASLPETSEGPGPVLTPHAPPASASQRRRRSSQRSP